MAEIKNIKQVSLKDLKPYEKNARLHSDEQVQKIADSIKAFGFLNPCIIDKDNNVIAGHGRIMAGELLGLESVPCVYVEGLTDEERKAYILADNRLAEMSDWDMDIVMGELEELQIGDFDISLTGFEIEEEEPIEVEEDDYDYDRKAEPRTKRGDIWQLGNHRLMCGDSTSIDDVERLMGGCKAEICITSPPYNASHMDVDGQESTKKKYLNDDDDMTDDEYMDFIQSNIDAIFPYTNEIFYNISVLSGNKKVVTEFIYNNNDILKDFAFWVKTNATPVICQGAMNTNVEFIICFGHNNTKRFENAQFTRGACKSYIEGVSASGNEYSKVHKATFPIYLPSHFIEKFTNKNGNVLDCFGGTGTTLMACEQLDRNAYLMELEPKYCDIIIDRWEVLTGKEAVLANG